MKFRMLLPVVVLGLGAAPPVASPVDVVERQLKAYNANDAQAFAATYATDAEVYKPAAGPAPVLSGRDAIRAHYAARFAARPSLQVEIAGRLTAGAFVSDHERITGTATVALVVYEVNGGLIQRAWLFASPRR